MDQSIQPAPLWRRLAALGYDLFILAAISFAYGALATVIAVKLGNHAYEDYRPMLNGPAYQIGWLLCLAGYYIWCWHRSGQTIGMKTWKIQLHDKHNFAVMGVSWKACLVRTLVAPPAILLAGVGFWAALLDREKRSLQDQLSQTLVSFQPQTKSEKLNSKTA